MSTELLTRLESVRWNIISQTYGSSHATLIGLLVDWWMILPRKSGVVKA